MIMLKKVDPEARQLLEESNFRWYDNAFVETRKPGEEKTEDYRNRQKLQIDYDSLRDHGLAGEAPPKIRNAGLQWLIGLLRRYDSTSINKEH